MATKSTKLCGPLLAWATLALSAPASVRADAPVVGPQWTESFWRDVPAFDGMANSRAPSWVRTQDGSTALLTMSDGLLFRRFDPAGAVVELARLTPRQAGIPVNDLGEVLIEADPIDGGFHLLVNAGPASRGCWLVHVDAGFRVQWSIEAPGASIHSDGCLGFRVLADGSALVIRSSALARVGSEGQTLWSRGITDGDNLRAEAFAVEAQNVIWVAGGWNNHATVARYSTAGEPLSSDAFLCGPCIASRALAIDILPNGDALVGGVSGSFQPGFLVRYDSTGARRLCVV